MAVCSEIHTKHINTLCGQNVELLNVKLVVYIVTTGLHRFNNKAPSTFCCTQLQFCRSTLVIHSCLVTKHITNKHKGKTICCSLLILSMFLGCICSKFKYYNYLCFSASRIVVIWGMSKQIYRGGKEKEINLLLSFKITDECECFAPPHIEKFNLVRLIMLTILQWVERRVECPAAGQPSPSWQDLLLVYFGIPLCYPPYTHHTATCAPPPCWHIDRHVLTRCLCSHRGHPEPSQSPGQFLIIL